MCGFETNGFGAQFETHLTPIYNKTISNPFRNIDFIYLINLDQRPEKLYNTLKQLSVFDIVPCRFPAIYGWGLSLETLNDIGLNFQQGMQGDQWCVYYPLQGNGEYQFEFLGDSSVGKTCFSRWISLGAIGCTLSHLSILEDAYNAGYELIWVMEDDILVCGNPLFLSGLIDELDILVGREKWDILYTDIDTSDAPLYSAPNSFETDLNGTLWFMWRPDMPSNDMTPYRKREVISSDFLKIGSRMRTHSMIITRAGIEKILTYEKNNGIFIPYDHELSLVPGIQLYSLRYPLVSFSEVVSDIKNQHFQPLE